MNKVQALALIALLATGCAAEPESQANGSCSLSCSQPRVGSSRFKVRPLGPTAVELACVSNEFNGNQLAPLNGPLQVRYQIYEEVENMFPTDPPSDGGAAGGGAALQGEAGGGTVPKGDPPFVVEEPRAGIGFEPVLYGLLNVNKSNEEFKSGPDTVSSFKYAGVVTSSSEWCSDSCGVITYEFWPDCKQNDSHTVTAGVAVAGGAQADAYTFTISN